MKFTSNLLLAGFYGAATTGISAETTSSSQSNIVLILAGGSPLLAPGQLTIPAILKKQGYMPLC